MKKEAVLAFAIDKFNVVETKGSKYVTYTVAINTPFKSWKVDRRYTQFREFKIKMEKRLEEKGVKEKVRFPRKLLFSNFKSKALHARMRQLEHYLNQIAQLLNLIDYPETWEFLEIEPHTRTFLSSLEYELHTDPSTFCTESEKLEAGRRREWSEDMILCGGRKEARQINDFLQRLHSEPLMIAKAVKDFESLYFGTKLQFNKSEIQQLLWGDHWLRGLLYYCGNSENYIGANYCLDFFAKLLKYEYNSVEADKFVAAYGKTDPSLVKQMSLDKYIKEIRSLDNAGLLAVYYYLKCNTHDISEPEEILKDKEAIEEYEKWLQNKLTCGYLFKMSVRKSSSKGTMAETKDGSEAEEDEKEEVRVMAGRSLEEIKVTKTLVETSKAIASQRLEYLAGQVDNYSAWGILSTAETEPGNDLLKAYTHGKQNFRVTIQVHCDDAKRVAAHFIDPEKRSAWERIRHSFVSKESGIDIVHSIYAPRGKAKYTEYVLGRQIEEVTDFEGEHTLIKDFSITLPQSTLAEIKRVYVNASVCKVAPKIDIEGRSYVECQILWSVDEGYTSLPEYSLYTNRELESEVMLLNKLLD